MMEDGRTRLEVEGFEIDLDVQTGTILGDKKWSETHVYSTGGGGYMGPSGGYVNLPQTHSARTTRHEIWFKPDHSEKEIALDLRNIEINIREGQRISLISAEIGRKRQTCTLVNHASKQTFSLRPNIQSLTGIRPPSILLGALVGLVLAFIVWVFAMAAYERHHAGLMREGLRLEAAAFQVDPEKYISLTDLGRQGVRLQAYKENRTVPRVEKPSYDKEYRKNAGRIGLTSAVAAFLLVFFTSIWRNSKAGHRLFRVQMKLNETIGALLSGRAWSGNEAVVSAMSNRR